MRTSIARVHHNKRSSGRSSGKKNVTSSLEEEYRSARLKKDEEESFSAAFRWYLWLIAREVIPEWDHRRKVRAKARDLFVYLLFMLTAFITAVSSQRFLNPFDFAQGEQDHFFFAQVIKDQLTKVEINAEYVPNTAKTFLQISTVEEFHQWTYSALHRTLFKDAGTFDGQSNCNSRLQSCTRAGETLGPIQIFGAVRIGQVRSKKRQHCIGDQRMVLPETMELNLTVPRCFGNAAGKFTYGGGLDGNTEENEDFGLFNLTQKPFYYDGIYTTPQRLGQKLKKSRRPKHERQYIFSTYLSSGNYWYPAPAYNIILDPRRALPDYNLHILKSLASSHYIDLQTRAVFVDCIFFNPMLKLFTKVRMLLELSRSGGARPSYYADTVRLFYDLPSSTDHTVSEVTIWILRFFGLGSFYFYYMLQMLRRN